VGDSDIRERNVRGVTVLIALQGAERSKSPGDLRFPAMTKDAADVFRSPTRQKDEREAGRSVVAHADEIGPASNM
jgi:hypothetical protein